MENIILTKTTFKRSLKSSEACIDPRGRLLRPSSKQFATYVGAKYALALSSGTAALHLAALVAGVGPGKTLITSRSPLWRVQMPVFMPEGRLPLQTLIRQRSTCHPLALQATIKGQSDGIRHRSGPFRRPALRYASHQILGRCNRRNGH
jgi:hypothetical protein